MKLIHTGIRTAVYNTAMTIAREVRTNTGYKRASQNAHAIMRQMLNQTDNIDTFTLDQLPTTPKITAATKLSAHLTSTETRYPVTNLILKYATKMKTLTLRN